jgi:hypothetical protein
MHTGRMASIVRRTRSVQRTSRQHIGAQRRFAGRRPAKVPRCRATVKDLSSPGSGDRVSQSRGLARAQRAYGRMAPLRRSSSDPPAPPAQGCAWEPLRTARASASYSSVGQACTSGAGGGTTCAPPGRRTRFVRGLVPAAWEHAGALARAWTRVPALERGSPFAAAATSCTRVAEVYENRAAIGRGRRFPAGRARHGARCPCRASEHAEEKTVTAYLARRTSRFTVLGGRGHRHDATGRRLHPPAPPRRKPRVVATATRPRARPSLPRFETGQSSSRWHEDPGSGRSRQYP